MARNVRLSSKKTKDRSKIAKQNKTRRRKYRSSRKKSKLVKKLSRLALAFVGVTILIGVISLAWGITYLQRITAELPSPDQPFKTQPTPSIIYDRHGIDGQGTELYKIIGDVNSDPVNIDAIPDIVRWAFLAAEDVDFYTHFGYDLPGIVRCGINYLRDSSSICGGSTITQQLVKITTLSNEVRLERKIKELFTATRVEQEFSKDEILQMYLQVAPFGSNIVGIEAAADYYFDKDPSELTLAEAAILASIIQNPSFLSPTRPVDGDTVKAQASVKERQSYVLGQMERYMNQINEQTRINNNDPEMENIITPEIIEEARNQELTYSAPIATDKLAGHFVDFVIGELQTKNYKNGEEPFSLDDLQNGGYKIYTTLDYELQKIAEETTRNAVATVEQGVYGTTDNGNLINMHNAALMTILPSTGEIVTMAGSKNFYGASEGCNEQGFECDFDGEVNILTTLQSPGSTNKSLAYYMAYENGTLAPGSNLPDVPIKIGEYEPKNWNASFIGPDLTAREALRQSRNIPALIVLELIGIENYIETSIEWGYTSYTGQYGPSVVLGGATVYPIEHAQAHGVFANGGDFVPYNAILKIEDKEGNVVYEARPERRTIANPQAVYLLNQTLYNLNDGRFNISWDGRPVAGKTGTSERSIDNWLIMYSPDFVTLGWAGNNNNSEMDLTYGYPTYTVSPWLKDYMTRIGDAPYFASKSNFSSPAYVFRGTGCDENGQNCSNTAGSDWLIQGKIPPAYKKTQVVEVCSDQRNRLARPIDRILGFAETLEVTEYVMPVEKWQGFLDSYLEDNGIPNGSLTEECDIDRTNGIPGPLINITSPAEGEEISGNSITISGGIYTATGTLTSVEITVNGQEVGSITGGYESFTETFDLSSINLSRSNTLNISARDTNGFNTTESITFRDASAPVAPNQQLGTLTISVKNQNLTFGSGESALIEANYDGTNRIGSVTLYAISSETGDEFEVGSMTSVDGGKFFILYWNSNEVPQRDDSYSFYAVGENSSETTRSNTAGTVRVNL